MSPRLFVTSYRSQALSSVFIVKITLLISFRAFDTINTHPVYLLIVCLPTRLLNQVFCG